METGVVAVAVIYYHCAVMMMVVDRECVVLAGSAFHSQRTLKSEMAAGHWLLPFPFLLSFLLSLINQLINCLCSSVCKECCLGYNSKRVLLSHLLPVIWLLGRGGLIKTVENQREYSFVLLVCVGIVCENMCVSVIIRDSSSSLGLNFFPLVHRCTNIFAMFCSSSSGQFALFTW